MRHNNMKLKAFVYNKFVGLHFFDIEDSIIFSVIGIC